MKKKFFNRNNNKKPFLSIFIKKMRLKILFDKISFFFTNEEKHNKVDYSFIHVLVHNALNSIDWTYSFTAKT